MTGPSICVVGHPYGPLGTARAARCSFASFRAAAADVRILDVWNEVKPDPIHANELAPHATREFADFNLFHLNGDEIEPALEHLGGMPRSSYNVVFPMWELPRYPSTWARQLERFDEVWAASKFIADAISPSVAVPVIHMPLATQLDLRSFRSRRYFGIPESPYTFLFFFDLRSYIDRKNPSAVIEAFERFLRWRPWAQACLVIKVHGSANATEVARELRERVTDLGPRALLIDRQMQEDEAHALIYNCDAFVSLHRAEGYGLGLAEAMSLGKPVIGTAYSGNMDFMSSRVAHLVRYRLVPVPESGYPHWEDQVWADPDINRAARALLKLYDDPSAGRRLGRLASSHMLAHFSFRAAGLRYLSRLDAALAETSDGRSYGPSVSPRTATGAAPGVARWKRSSRTRRTDQREVQERDIAPSSIRKESIATRSAPTATTISNLDAVEVDSLQRGQRCVERLRPTVRR